MLFDDVLKHPALKKALAAGEEQAGRVVGRLLSSEAVASGVQNLISAASTARTALDVGLQTARRAANVPSADEVQALKQKIADLEALVEDLTARVDEQPRRDPPGDEPAAR